MGTRVIFHVDMDAFFAAIEIVHNPSLRGKPVIIGGLPDQRGVVSTCSYEARTFGVRSAMSLFEAHKRCPHGIFLEGSYHLYKEYSHQIMQIFQACTPFVEIVSIDEAYIDVSQIVHQYGGPKALGELLKAAVFKQTQLNCSVGIASNKLVAKIASSYSKPNGLHHVPFGEEAAFLSPLEIQSIPGIGMKTQIVLNSDGFKFIKDLQQSGLEELMRLYGTHGYHYYQAAMGMDTRPVEWEDMPPKSIGAETTFEIDQSDTEVLEGALLEMCEKAWRRLKKHKMRTRGLSLKLRFSNFRTITRSCVFNTHINNLELIHEEASSLMKKHYQGELPLRLIGVSLEKLTDTYWQPTLWD